ncbi:MAG: tetratricopeptide repeat protein [Rhodothermales bacterium]|nr:tetratricopeptide repeat protein [Rhodothermales bacterium]MBO6778555.1 tetratricopeptide repeat protein [Rhodothermales bacterium]
MKRFIFAALLFAGAAAFLLTADTQSLPDRGTIVTASASSAGAEASLIERVMREPNRADGYVDLAQYYLGQARATADETFFVPRVEAQLKKALDLDPNHYRARVLRGTLLNKLHQFEQSEAQARELIAESPGHAYNYGTLVDALVELGRYDEAVTAMDQMLERRPDLSSYSRASYIRELLGDEEGAIRAMEFAAGAGTIGSEGRSWALYQLSQLALGSGDHAAARRILTGILEEHPGYAHAVAGLAHLALLEGRVQHADYLIEQAMALAPGAGFEELALEVYLAMGDEQRAAEATIAIERGLEDAQAMGENVNMELADFYADEETRLDGALWLASIEIARRPDHLHANETYAWVLHKLGRSEQAIEFIDHAMRFDNGDAKLSFRAGQIYVGAGLVAQGRTLLERALEEGLHIESPSAAAEATDILAG